MNLTEICIIKRDGKRENFSPSKITNAISKAFNATGLAHQEELIDEITQRVIAHFENPTIGVEEIQDLVETELRLPRNISFIASGEIQNAIAKRR